MNKEFDEKKKLSDHSWELKFYMIAVIILIFGALNVGVLALLGVNVIHYVNEKITGIAVIERIFFVIVGIAALYVMFSRTTYLPFLGRGVLPARFINTDLHPSSVQTNVVEVDAKNANSVVYWAADPSVNGKTYDEPSIAYKNFENSGVVPVDSDGKARLFFRCPGKYKVGSLIKYELPKHIHYRLVFDDYIDSVKTIEVECDD